MSKRYYKKEEGYSDGDIEAGALTGAAAAEEAERESLDHVNMSRDIRTQINAVMGMTMIAGANADRPDKVKECLGSIAASSRRLMKLVDTLLGAEHDENRRDRGPAEARDTEKHSANCLEIFANEDHSGKRILLVEDNDINREIAVEILKTTGVAIDTAENGKEACDKIASYPEDRYDLVLMDIQMPVMNGYEATAAIRAMDGRRKDIPVVAMTANAYAEDVRRAANAGMNGHIAKPIDLEKLKNVLSKWLKNNNVN